MKNKIAYFLKRLTKNLHDILIDVEIKKELLSLYNYKENYKKILIFISLLPISFIFFWINIIISIISIFFYLIIFLLKILLNKKTTKIKYKKRFRFLKNYYLIILEKILIEFPKKRGFLIFYLIMKKIIYKEKSDIETEFLKKWVKAISNRFVIRILLGVPFIVIKINKDLTDLIWDLKDFNYENKEAFIATVILNIYKNVTPDYNKLIEKLKIIIIKSKKKKNIIKFNSSKELFKAIKYQEKFKKDFLNIKKKCIYASVKHKIGDNKTTKFHPTLIFKVKNWEMIYINETSSKYLNCKKYNDEIKKYINETQKNCHYHKGSINSKKDTYYTKPIKTDKENVIIQIPYKDSFIKQNVIEENTNNITASFLVNLESNIIKTIENIESKEKILFIDKEEKFIDWIKNNKEIIENDSFETLLSIQFFWEENKKIIENLSIEKKIDLAKFLGANLDIFEDPKEINFLMFKSFISKDLKIK